MKRFPSTRLDSRQLAVVTAVFVTSLGPGFAQTERTLTLACLTPQVAQFEKVEWQLGLDVVEGNPFNPDDVDVHLELISPGGGRQRVPAFYFQDYERRRVGPANRERDWLYPRGQPGWKARFAPTLVGTYQAVAVLRDGLGTARSATNRFECTSSNRRGFVRASQRDPRYLEFSPEQPFFPIGQNLAFIGEQQHVTLSKAERIFDQLATNGANYLRIWTGAEDWALAIEARKSAWGRSWDWHAPIVPEPGAISTNRQCLELAGARGTLVVNPSHAVALRPGTAYVLRGRIRDEPGSSVHLELRGATRELVRPEASESWTEWREAFETGEQEYWLEPFRFRLTGAGKAWVTDLSLKERAGGPELLWEADVNRPVRGFYNPVDCFMLDELVRAAEARGIYLQLCLLTRDLYMDALKDPTAPAYDEAIQDAKRFFRHAVARWGYSTSVAAWEYWNEMNPGLPTDRFYSALGEYLEEIDLYHHLRTTSTWGPSAKDCRHAKIDLADLHFYLRPVDRSRLRDEVDAVLERTRWLREQAPKKPAHLGEFGLADDKWQATKEMRGTGELADFHNGLWASALSGASGTAMFWWWERLDQRNAYPVYQPLAMFLQDVPWTGGELATAAVEGIDDRVVVIGLQSPSQAWLWLFNKEAAWAKLVLEHHIPAEIPDMIVQLNRLNQGIYQVEWWDTRSGSVLRREKIASEGSRLRITPPAFQKDVAGKVKQITNAE